MSVNRPLTGAEYIEFNGFATWSRAGVEYLSDATRTVTGVSLQEPSAAGPQTGLSLTYTHTSATDRTLAYNGGTPVQLVLDSGTVTSGSNSASNYDGGNSTFGDTSKTWPGQTAQAPRSA